MPDGLDYVHGSEYGEEVDIERAAPPIRDVRKWHGREFSQAAWTFQTKGPVQRYICYTEEELAAREKIAQQATNQPVADLRRSQVTACQRDRPSAGPVRTVRRKVVKLMARIYAALIRKGIKTLEDVPARLRDAVEALLQEDGHA